MLEKIYRKIYINFFVNTEKIEKEEREKFNQIGCSQSEALSKLNTILKALRGEEFNLERDSVHWLIWSAVSIKKNPLRILEIGTSMGEGTRILAELFPKAEIITVDLPESDPILRKYYGRDDDSVYRKYIEEQSKNLKYKNIKSIKVNSFFLPEHVTGNFDLIWIDGGHLFPDIAWDISNAWNMASQGSIIMCDDVIPTEKICRDQYVSSESFKIINYIKDRTSIKPFFFLKRRNPNLYVGILKRKFVAYIIKP